MSHHFNEAIGYSIGLPKQNPEILPIRHLLLVR